MTLREAIAKVLEGFDTGVFVRSTDGDADPQWAMKLLPYIQALATLKEALQRAEQAMQEDETKAGECPVVAPSPKHSGGIASLIQAAKERAEAMEREPAEGRTTE
jgi:hypothetical protein